MFISVFVLGLVGERFDLRCCDLSLAWCQYAEPFEREADSTLSSLALSPLLSLCLSLSLPLSVSLSLSLPL